MKIFKWFKKGKHRATKDRSFQSFLMQLEAPIEEPVIAESLCDTPQFECGTCGWRYDGTARKHGNCPETLWNSCTHCGESFNPWDGLHSCEPYGRHAIRPGSYLLKNIPVKSQGRHRKWEENESFAFSSDVVTTLPNKLPNLIKAGTKPKSLLLIGQST